MHFEGNFKVKAPRQRVYDLVLDPNQISKCMPELQRLDVVSPDDFTAVVKAGIAFIKGDFTLHFTVVEKDNPNHAKLTARGTGIGSTVDMETMMDLSEIEGGGTSMKWQAEVKVGGRIASLGQRLIVGQAQKIIEQLFGCLQSKLESS